VVTRAHTEARLTKTLTLGAEIWQYGPATVYLSHQGGVDHGTEDLARDVLEAPVGDHPAIVDPHVDTPEALRRRGGKRSHRRLIADIGGH
jgi:hypothetical protein